MRILWHSNAPWAATGYGQQTSLLVPLMREAGHEVAISAFYGLQGAKLEWNGIPVYPGGLHPYGNDVLLRHATDWFGGQVRHGLILTLIDAWVLDGPALTRACVGSWAPVDHDPLPPFVLAFFEASGARPIAMSRFGEAKFREAGLDPLYVPHGIDTEVYCPSDQREARKTLGIPESAFVVGMVAANKGHPARKGIPEAIDAFARVRAQIPEAVLYLHTEPYGVMDGVHIPAVIDAVGLPPDAVRFPEPYRYLLGAYPPGWLALAYNAMDVLINPAFGEGFGIPIVEAQACGTPVIVTDYTAMSELAGPGWRIGGQRWFGHQRSWWLMPSVDELASAMLAAYDANLTDRGEVSREFSLAYDYRRVFADYWAPALAALEPMLGDLPLPELAIAS